MTASVKFSSIESITVYDDGKQSRCFTDVSDVVNGLVALMDSGEAFGQVFNIGSYNEISILDLAKKIIKMTNSSSEIVFISYDDAYGEGFEDMRKRIPNITKIKNTVGYLPQITLDQIIKNVISYHKDK